MRPGITSPRRRAGSVYAPSLIPLPGVRQQCLEAMLGGERQPLEHIAQVGVGIEAVEPHWQGAFEVE